MNIEEDLREEIKKAESKFHEYHSPHEGYAVILEELDELWDEVRKHDHNEIKMYKEAIQVACTAVRFCKMIQKNYNGILHKETKEISVDQIKLECKDIIIKALSEWKGRSLSGHCLFRECLENIDMVDSQKLSRIVNKITDELEEEGIIEDTPDGEFRMK